MSGRINHNSKFFGREGHASHIQRQQLKDQNFAHGKIRDVAKAMNGFYGDEVKWGSLELKQRGAALEYIKLINKEVEKYNKECSESVDKAYNTLISNGENEENSTSVSKMSLVALAKKCMRSTLKVFVESVIGASATKDLIRYMNGMGKVDTVHTFDEKRFFDTSSQYHVDGNDLMDSDDGFTIGSDSENEISQTENGFLLIDSVGSEEVNSYDNVVSERLKDYMKDVPEFRKAVEKYLREGESNNKNADEIIKLVKAKSSGAVQVFDDFYYSKDLDKKVKLIEKFGRDKFKFKDGNFELSEKYRSLESEAEKLAHRMQGNDASYFYYSMLYVLGEADFFEVY